MESLRRLNLNVAQAFFAEAVSVLHIPSMLLDKLSSVFTADELPL
jgi:hypothetical protein